MKRCIIVIFIFFYSVSKSQSIENFDDQLKGIDSLIQINQLKQHRKEFTIIYISRIYKQVDYLVLKSDTYFENWWRSNRNNFPQLKELEDSNKLEFFTVRRKSL